MKYLMVVLSIFFATSAFAGDIYKWVDEQGVTHFTSKKPHPDAKPAKLPELMHGEFKVPAKFGVTCEKHGGINCSAGADKDGSVVCMDGFKSASARFAFQCSSPKLVVSDISNVDENGEFKVFLRNSNSVAAKGTTVEFFYADDKKVNLNGPATVDPFGVAEFTFTPTDGVKVTSKPSETQLSISCGNCG